MASQQLALPQQGMALPQQGNASFAVRVAQSAY
jgi:hypothetical protein